MTQAKVSEITGISEGALSKMENRLINPRFSTLRKLAECFGADWRDLVED